MSVPGIPQGVRRPYARSVPGIVYDVRRQIGHVTYEGCTAPRSRPSPGRAIRSVSTGHRVPDIA
eukprot:1821488-Rhodomonas_salina.4